MTSINAIKFNSMQGAMLCDEQRGWNEEDMMIMTADKIKPVTTPTIEKKLRFAASYGNTGTSSIGDELKFKIMQKVTDKYNQLVKLKGDTITELMTIEELANEAFNIQIELKHRHIDETFKGRYGFTTSEFLAGKYSKGDESVEIKQEDIIASVHDDITWQKRTGDMTPVFLNAGIIAGYEPREGFRIFHLSLIEHLCEPVQEIFLNDGSGRDMSMVLMTEYTNNLSIPERRGDIDPVEGLFAMINAVNAASRFNLGVGGYFNIILFDGKAEEAQNIRTEISDFRAKLASHIVHAAYLGILTENKAKDLLGELIFEKVSFERVFNSMMKQARNEKKLSRMMRGYKTYTN